VWEKKRTRGGESHAQKKTRSKMKKKRPTDPKRRGGRDEHL